MTRFSSKSRPDKISKFQRFFFSKLELFLVPNWNRESGFMSDVYFITLSQRFFFCGIRGRDNFPSSHNLMKKIGKLPFCLFAILPTCHFANLPFCHLPFVNLPFCQVPFHQQMSHFVNHVRNVSLHLPGMGPVKIINFKWEII